MKEKNSPVVPEPTEAEITAKVLEESAENKEDAAATIKEIKSERKEEKKKRKPWVTALMIIFFPITPFVLLFKWVSGKVKLSITTKTTVIFTAVFGVLITAYVIFIIVSVHNQLTSPNMEDVDSFLFRMKITSVVLVIVFIVLGAALGNIASRYMMTPLRRMIDSIDKVDGNNLSTRLDPVDSQDELTELTQQINEMLEVLENTFERQSNFISDASHELQTPISVIQGYANMLKRWGKSDPALLEESIDTLLGEAENMKRIVEQLLLLAKIGNFTMNKTRFDMCEQIGDVVQQYRVAGLKKEIEFDGSGEIWVETDKNMLIESVRALIDNAIKYTPDGGKITVACKRNEDGALIRVKDNGIGIAPEHLPHIFERFYRCDKARSRAAGSSGLGLTITKSIVEMMGGKINVTSVPDMGSTFTIQLY